MYTANELIERIKGEAESLQDRERKEKAEFQQDVFLGVIEPYVRREMKRFYTETDDFIVFAAANVCKKAVEQLARLYSKKPKRTFNNCTETQVKALEDLYAEMQFNQTMLKVNQLYKLSNQTHFQVLPVINFRGEKSIGLRLLPNQNLNVVRNELQPEMAEAYAISAANVRAFRLDSNGDDELVEIMPEGQTFSVWSKELNFVFNTKYGITSEETENVLGMIPIIEVAGLKYGDYWKTSTESFADFTIQLNTSISDAGQAKRFQGMPLGWIKGTEDQLKGSFAFGPNKMIKLPTDMAGNKAEIGFTNPSVDLDKLINFDSALLSLFLTCADLDPSSVNAKGISQKYNSGFERMLSMIQMFEPSERDEDVFKNVEQKAFEVIVRYLETFGGVQGYTLPNVGTFSKDASVSVVYEKPEQIVSKEEKLSIIEREISLGLISRLEAVADYRQVSIQEAQAFIDSQTPPRGN